MKTTIFIVFLFVLTLSPTEPTKESTQRVCEGVVGSVQRHCRHHGREVWHRRIHKEYHVAVWPDCDDYPVFFHDPHAYNHTKAGDKVCVTFDSKTGAGVNLAPKTDGCKPPAQVDK